MTPNLLSGCLRHSVSHSLSMLTSWQLAAEITGILNDNEPEQEMRSWGEARRFHYGTSLDKSLAMAAAG